MGGILGTTPWIDVPVMDIEAVDGVMRNSESEAWREAAMQADAELEAHCKMYMEIEETPCEPKMKRQRLN